MFHVSPDGHFPLLPSRESLVSIKPWSLNGHSTEATGEETDWNMVEQMQKMQNKN